MTIYRDLGKQDEEIPDGEERETPGEEETTEEADSCDSEDAFTLRLIPTEDSVFFRPGMKFFDESGALLGELVPIAPDSQPSSFTPKDRKRARKRRERHHTRRWYSRQLLAIAEGKLKMSKEELRAFHAFGRLRGWHRSLPSKR